MTQQWQPCDQTDYYLLSQRYLLISMYMGIFPRPSPLLQQFFMLIFYWYLSFDWCFGLMPRTMHWYSIIFGNIKSFSDFLKYRHTCTFFTVCVYGTNWLACMVTLSIEWHLNHMHISLSSDWGIFVNTKWLHSRTSEPCSLALKVQALDAHALIPGGGKDLCVR